MQFYDVLAGGNRTALTRPQIAGLFQAGQLGCNDPCREAGRTEWRTIDEVFPLLKHGTTARSLYQPTELHNPQARSIALVAAISILILSATLLAGYFAFRGGAAGSRDAITANSAANPPAPVSYTIENPYFLSPKARAAKEERLNAARRAREQAARLTQERAEAERKEAELRDAAGNTERIQRSRSTPVSPGASRKPHK